MKRIALLLCALAMFSACRTSPPPANGWAIVAADPVTGDVGIAGASCGVYPFDYRAVLVPKQGALAQLGVASPLQRDRANAWMQTPLDAPTVGQRITAPANDPEAAARQYAIVTIHQGTTQVSSFTGADTAPWAGDMADKSLSAAAVGSGLTQQAALNDALAVFRAPGDANATLSDKLLHSLEAASAAGGVARCNGNSIRQTASTGFVMMARGGDPPFRVQTLGNQAKDEPNAPFLALSTIQPIGGKNAVLPLRQEYNKWRAGRLPACASCMEPLVTLPEGGTMTEPADAFLTENAFRLVAGFVAVVMLITILFFAIGPRRARAGR